VLILYCNNERSQCNYEHADDMESNGVSLIDLQTFYMKETSWYGIVYIVYLLK